MNEPTKEQMENFERAFSSGCSGCHRDCACGKIYFDAANSWDWGDGELDELRANPGATAVDYSIGGIVFDGVEYANACNCWEPKAKKIILWMDFHRREIVEWFNLEKKRKLAEAAEAPVVTDDEYRSPHPDL